MSTRLMVDQLIVCRLGCGSPQLGLCEIVVFGSLGSFPYRKLFGHNIWSFRCSRWPIKRAGGREREREGGRGKTAQSVSVADCD